MSRIFWDYQNNKIGELDISPDSNPLRVTDTKITHFYDRCPLVSGRHRVKILPACLIDWLIALPTFSYSRTRATRDIIVEGDELEELEEVKTIKKTILELGWVMPHSGFGATLNPDPLKKNFPPPKFFFSHSKFSTKWYFGIPPKKHLWVSSRPFSGHVSHFVGFFCVVLY